MSFGLKNTGVDFQENMNKAFEGLIRIIMEVYVDDMYFWGLIRQLFRIHSFLTWH